MVLGDGIEKELVVELVKPESPHKFSVYPSKSVMTRSQSELEFVISGDAKAISGIKTSPEIPVELEGEKIKISRLENLSMQTVVLFAVLENEDVKLGEVFIE